MITVEQYPSQLTPTYNPIVFTASSTNVSQPNFRYVVDVYIDGQFENRLIIPPNASNDYLFVDVAPVIEPLISSAVDKSISDNSATGMEFSSAQYVVKFGEQYGSSGTIYADLVTTPSMYTWNAILDYEEFVDYSSGDYQASVSTPCQFLTNRPSSGDIYVDDNAWLYWIRLFKGLSVFYTRIITYDSTGAIIATRITNDGDTGNMYRIPSGPNNLNNITNVVIVSGPAQPIITGSVAKYSIQLVDSLAGTNPMSEIYYYTIASDCSEYDKVNVVFLNALGGYDSFAFIKAGRRSAQIERKEYKTFMGGFDELLPTFSYSKSDRAITQYHTKIKDSYSVESDWITEEQSAWLEELISSPDVYVDNGTVLIPIVVTNSNYERKRGVNEKLFNLRLEYKYSYERYRQRR